MDDAGQRLKKRREDLGLRYRDVEEASTVIAERRKNPEYQIALSRLADIENKGAYPSIYKLYTLCAIYRMDLSEVLTWYGIDTSNLPTDAMIAQVPQSHVLGFKDLGVGALQVPLALDPGIDPRRTTYLSRMIQRWGLVPLMLLSGLGLQKYRYAFLGSEDTSMYPLLHPGSLLLIDESRRKIATEWNSESDRPIYFLERRNGYLCGWCSLRDSQLIVMPHPASRAQPECYLYPDEIDVIGQVVGVAMRLYSATPARARS